MREYGKGLDVAIGIETCKKILQNVEDESLFCEGIACEYCPGSIRYNEGFCQENGWECNTEAVREYLAHYEETLKESEPQPELPPVPESPSVRGIPVCMNHQDFVAILDARVSAIKETLEHKAKEYAVGGNRLHNFEVAARMNGETAREALWGMATKHLVCIQDIVHSDKVVSKAMSDEKIGDMINYLILLEAILADERRVLS